MEAKILVAGFLKIGIFSLDKSQVLDWHIIVIRQVPTSELVSQSFLDHLNKARNGD